MRRTILLLALIAAVSSTAMSQANQRSANHSGFPGPSPAAPCRGESLSVKEVDSDAAMGGVRTVDYAFTNKSSSACTLYGYPSYQLFDRRGRLLRHGRAVKSDQLPGDETKHSLQLITIEPGKEAWFRVYYNAGGAGYVGKPCPVARKIRIVAPGTRRPLVLRGEITLCGDLQISSVRGGPRRE